MTSPKRRPRSRPRSKSSGVRVTAPREAVIATFRRHLIRVQSDVRTRFEQSRIGGLEAARLLAAHADVLIVALCTYASRLQRLGSPDDTRTANFCIAATGGYGRSVLAPFSDIDLLFLTADAPDPAVLKLVEFMLYFLWDLGLKVGHATRTIDECLTDAATDSTIRTSLLDARPLTGDRALFDAFTVRFGQDCEAAGPGGYIAAKQAERAARHHRYGDSPFVVEPNIKEGRGALRDLQTLYWMARLRVRHHRAVVAGGRRRRFGRD